ncbi:cryptochrome/deoxyribodipyrimidine photo-lyase family protein [Glaciecola sp. KUL10]|uniref:cryptochrome/deoxyribodipyrimidine photo-lyase family protein n=1 Tax=Glaciecola sp. (strain KUL10) TaxID=2161813 RepID=UPI000D78C076|nr:deoxyribodipyrimidine photo-lyase [Glaciecola sp. KUL10]GBL02867.1 deoxyribodipyrimidine photolyase [Glaciecola sp. KUL10]
MKPSINIVWLKRDLRLRDHEPLANAIAHKQPILLLYIVEPINLKDPHMDIRHWRFIYESIQDLNQQLEATNNKILIMHGDADDVFSDIGNTFDILNVFSHQEIGLDHTFQRDKKLKTWFRNNSIEWHEATYGAVVRPLNDRLRWRKHWDQRILSPQHFIDFDKLNALLLSHKAFLEFDTFQIPIDWQTPNEHFQIGGEKRAWYTLKHFFETRGKGYFGNMGKPTESRQTCSRLSPYLAWGNISLKQVYQFSLTQEGRDGWSRSINAFQSRLHWHCHFVQKFESEADIEFRPVNRAYLEYPYLTEPKSTEHLQAWQKGETGIPIVDACMKCVVKTGYLNFRMRAMVVSFLCHHLNVDWRQGVTFLGAQFLDFEPGIHYPQFQMQAGITGTNTIRIYNPIKQSIDKDPDGVFIRKWLPVLADIPSELIHTPWKLTPLECQMYDFEFGKDYPTPVVDVDKAAAQARERLWNYRKRDDVKKEAKRVLFRHSVLI